jgi:RHS repeat-associated protein
MPRLNRREVLKAAAGAAINFPAVGFAEDRASVESLAASPRLFAASNEKSGTASQVIPLPQGGGALKGIGETFKPDLFTGTGNLTVPLAVPRGRNGFQPEVNLEYSTGHGNGPFGLGWRVTIPEITRKTSNGVPRYAGTVEDPASDDTFILSGSDDLVYVGRSLEGHARFRPRTEGLYASIEHIQSNDQDDFWRIRSVDGLEWIYGTPGHAGEDPAAVADPKAPHNVFSWRLSQIIDPFRNKIAFDYVRDRVQERARAWDQLDVQRIRYIDIGDEDNPRFLISVIFQYDLGRPDEFSSRRSGFEVRTRRRCRCVEVQVGSDEPFRVYEFIYVDQRVSTGELTRDSLPPNAVSLLSMVRVIGRNAGETEELPPLEFGYTPFEAAIDKNIGRAYRRLTKNSGVPSSLTRDDVEVVDLFSNGLPSIVEIGDSFARSWRNRGDADATFDELHEMDQPPVNVQLGDPGVAFADMDGNGRADLLVPGRAAFFPLTSDGQWREDPHVTYESQHLPSAALSIGSDPNVHLVDLNGDGVVDLLETGTDEFRLFYSQPGEPGSLTARWIVGESRLRGPIEEFPNLPFDQPNVRISDLTGDGLQDCMRIARSEIDYWPYRGAGKWGPRLLMAPSPKIEDRFLPPLEFDPKRLLVGDVDGDGLDDILYVESERLTLWINQSGNGWSDPILIENTPVLNDDDHIRLADMLGAGTRGLLWAADTARPTEDRYVFLDFTAGTKPYLLDQIDNHAGAVTRIRYAPSTTFYAQDWSDPVSRWATTLPFPVHVVERVESIDAISRVKLTSQFRYHHGFWDGVEREFRGFGRVDQFDSEEIDDYKDEELLTDTSFRPVPTLQFSPPTELRTWFHLGAADRDDGQPATFDFTSEFWTRDLSSLSMPPDIKDPAAELPRQARRDVLRAQRGRILRSELRLASDGQEDAPFLVTEFAYGLQEFDAPPDESDRSRVFASQVRVERSTIWDRGDDPMTKVTFFDDYDEFGHARSRTAVSLPRRFAARHPISGKVVGEVDPDETRVLATHSRAEYARPRDNTYFHDLVAHEYTFELENPLEVNESSPSNLDQVLRDSAEAALKTRTMFFESLADWSATSSLPANIHLLSHTLNHYDGEAFVGLPVGEIGSFGALVRSETLVATERELDAAYAERRSEYLGGKQVSPPGTPANFGSNLGYRLETESSIGYQAGYYFDTMRRKFDVHDSDMQLQSGVVIGTEDGLGHTTLIVPDVHRILPEKVIDALGLETTATYDYRVMQPSRVTDPNGLSTIFDFTPLGLLSTSMLVGRSGEGDTPDKPGTQFCYKLLSFDQTRNSKHPQPMYVHSRQRVFHASDDTSDEHIETRVYSDGFGRIIQTRNQAEELAFGADGNDAGLLVAGKPIPGQVEGPAIEQRRDDRVVVSGWQIYDNKGRVVEKYEPFYSAGWNFQPESEAKQGPHATMSCDPRGRLVRTINPDGSEHRVVYGTLDDLARPDTSRPSPWESYYYDANDLASLTFDPTEIVSDGSAKSLTDPAPADHDFTPVSTVVDALGRVIARIDRNGHAIEDWFVTRSVYDLRGNPLVFVDALGRPSFKHSYDLLNRLLRVTSIDAGTRTSVLDAAGNVVELRDDRGGVTLLQYDPLNRLTHLWARDADAAPLTLRERLEYGGNDPLNRDADEKANRLGRRKRHFDGAGVVEFSAYDFKGNLIDETRQVISDAALAAGWVPDWSRTGSKEALDPTIYQTTTCFDAINRPIEITYPAQVSDAARHRAVLKPSYNRAGALKRVELDNKVYVERIDYDAKGQRVLMGLGNGVMTRYAYDRRTLRLVRLRSERYHVAEAGSPEWHGAGLPIQDLTYTYDLAGNILAIEEQTPGCGIAGAPEGRDRFVRRFTYDPVYRLSSATGRACKDAGAPRPTNDSARCGAYLVRYTSGPPAPNQENAPDVTEAYTENYRYDPTGNLYDLTYLAPSGSWRRRFGFGGFTPDQWINILNGHLNLPATTPNHLTRLEQGKETHQYHYDLNGNLDEQNTERHLEWDHADRLTSFAIRAGGASPPSLEARYLYGADGLRVKKWVRTNGTGDGESTVYIDGVFEHQLWKKPGQAAEETDWLHIFSGTDRIALVRRGLAAEDEAGPPIQYHLSDHLSSSHIVVGDNGRWMNREEYFPYGETSFGSFSRKRYRFIGKERDEETGFNYHGGRYYAPWMARWMSVDPLVLRSVRSTQPTGTPGSQTNEPSDRPRFDQIASPYVFAFSDPIDWVDHDGKDPSDFMGKFWDRTLVPSPGDFTVSSARDVAVSLLARIAGDETSGFHGMVTGVYDVANPESDLITRTTGGLGAVGGFSALAQWTATGMGNLPAAASWGAGGAVAGFLGLYIKINTAVPKAILQAKESIATEGFRQGGAMGFSAAVLGADKHWIRNNLLLYSSQADIATQYLGAMGLREQRFNRGLGAGFNTFTDLSAAQRSDYLQKSLDYLRAKGVQVDNPDNLLSKSNVEKLSHFFQVQ